MRFFSRKSRRAIRNCHPTNRLRFESLESRQMLTSGLLDPTFGAGGRVFGNFPGSANDIGSDVVIQPDGKTVVKGHGPLSQ